MYGLLSKSVKNTVFSFTVFARNRRDSLMAVLKGTPSCLCLVLSAAKRRY